METVIPEPLHHSLEDVNTIARDRLYVLFEQATPEQIPDLVESLAKLNASMRNNNQFDVDDPDKTINGVKSAIISNAIKGD